MSKRATRLHPAERGSEVASPAISQHLPHDLHLGCPPQLHSQSHSEYVNQVGCKASTEIYMNTNLTQSSDGLPMFHTAQTQSDQFDNNNTHLYSHSQPHQQEQGRKRRVNKACDMCRAKKTKCDGSCPCSKCILENRICSYTDRRRTEKMYPQHHVEMLMTRVRLLSKCLEGLFKKAKDREDVSYMAEKDGSLAINKLMEELELIDFPIQSITLNEPMFGNESDRNNSVHSVDSLIGTEQYPSSQQKPMQQHLSTSDFALTDQPQGYKGYHQTHEQQQQQQQQQQHQHHHHPNDYQNNPPPFQQHQQQPHFDSARQQNMHQPPPHLPQGPSSSMQHALPGHIQLQENPQKGTYQDHLQTDVPISLNETLFRNHMLPPFEDMHSKHFPNDFVFEDHN